MILAPFAWYGAVPGVAATGPFNPHFIRDIGCAYLLAGIALGLAACSSARQRAIPAAAFLVLHGLVHVGDFAAGREDFHHLLGDLPGVFLLPVLAVWIAWPQHNRYKEKSMFNVIKWLMNHQLTRFERQWNYDTSYAREMVEADPAAALTFARLMGLHRYRKDVPLEVYYAAAITGTIAEDCGPCAQLAIDMAARAGVAPAILRAIVARDVGAMPQEVALGLCFADATLRHAPERDAIRDDILRRWGKRALLSLTFALLAARLFPTAKYALGHGHACMRLSIGGETRPVALRAAEKAA